MMVVVYVGVELDISQDALVAYRLVRCQVPTPYLLVIVHHDG
eukprot:SAG11_NODE_2080_length_3853_cov_12.378796_1_plen_42_part_00